MGKWIEKNFLNKYKESSESFYQAKTLIYILVGLILTITLFIFIAAATETIPFMVGIIVSNIILLFVVKAGHNETAGIIMVVMLSILSCLMIFSGEFNKKYEVYFLAFILIFILIITLLISSKSIHSIIVMGLSIAAIGYDYFFRAIPAKLDGKAPDMDDYIIAAVLIIFAGIIVMGNHKRGKGLLRQVEGEVEVNKTRALAMERIIRELRQNFNTGDKLIHSSGLVFNFIDEIKSQIQSVKNEVNGLTRGSTRLREASTSMADSSDSVSRAVSDQSSIIHQFSAAVTEMAGSIESISSIAKERKNTIMGLSKISEEAGTAITESADSMAYLKNSISSLEEINDVIKGLADQTGLLAMNAAIEAAQAGDAGKGFAVVADEVRKLSEDSAENAQIISKTLEHISEAIGTANEVNNKTAGAYQKINKEIATIIRGMDEILQGISELSSGTAEINAGTSSSVDSTSKVKAGVAQVNGRIQDMAEELSGQEKAAEAVLTIVKASLEKLNLVHQETSRVKTIGQENADNLKALGENLSQVGSE